MEEVVEMASLWRKQNGIGNISYRSATSNQGKNKPKGVGIAKTSVNSALKTLRSI